MYPRPTHSDSCTHEGDCFCQYEDRIDALVVQTAKIDQFIEGAEPLLAYVRAEIDRNTERSRMYQRITEQVLGASILVGVGTIGAWIFAKLKSDIGMA